MSLPACSFNFNWRDSIRVDSCSAAAAAASSSASAAPQHPPWDAKWRKWRKNRRKNNAYVYLQLRMAHSVSRSFSLAHAHIYAHALSLSLSLKNPQTLSHTLPRVVPHATYKVTKGRLNAVDFRQHLLKKTDKLFLLSPLFWPLS